MLLFVCLRTDPCNHRVCDPLHVTLLQQQCSSSACRFFFSCLRSRVTLSACGSSAHTGETAVCSIPSAQTCLGSKARGGAKSHLFIPLFIIRENTPEMQMKANKLQSEETNTKRLVVHSLSLFTIYN